MLVGVERGRREEQKVGKTSVLVEIKDDNKGSIDRRERGGIRLTGGKERCEQNTSFPRAELLGKLEGGETEEERQEKRTYRSGCWAAHRRKRWSRHRAAC